MKEKVLFICTHNSARSQMAEGFLRAMYGDYYDVYSAGIETSKVNPYAIKVMAEIGIDISTQYSKNIDVFSGIKFDYVVTVCNQAKERCPFFQGGKEYLHCDFEDPSQINGNENQKLTNFKRVRDSIRNWIEKTFSKKANKPLIYRFFSRTKKLRWCVCP